MKKAYAVIGTNFGDEGKGLMTDYFCRNNPHSLNIRFNGGAQAGHTVVTSSGNRHIFSHIGAGTFSGADTYLSDDFIVNPMLFKKEYNILNSKFNLFPKVIISEKAVLSLPCDMIINQFIENSRGNQRHGSCGLGINETIKRSNYEKYRISFEDIIIPDTRCSISEFRTKFTEKIKFINENYVPKRLEELNIKNPPLELSEMISNENLIYNYITDCIDLYDVCRTNNQNNDKILNMYDTAVFEGAQGLLLDCERIDYFPNLTPSNTGLKNIRKILDKFPVVDTEICFVTRSYFTRHGAGKFISEDRSISDKYHLYDKTNQTNEYQGSLRYGFFDTNEFIKSLEIEKQYLKDYYKTSLCITHLNETNGKIICSNKKLTPDELKAKTYIQKLYKSYSEISDDIDIESIPNFV